jgi:hypothetical protein
MKRITAGLFLLQIDSATPPNLVAAAHQELKIRFNEENFPWTIYADKSNPEKPVISALGCFLLISDFSDPGQPVLHFRTATQEELDSGIEFFSKSLDNFPFPPIVH